MRTLKKKMTVLVLSIFYIGILFAYGSGVVVTAKNDKLLRLYEKGDKKFVKSEIGTYIVYFHQRKIGDALVEKDFIVYQFEKETKKLIKKIYHRRPHLPEKVKILFSENKAEAVVEGTILSKRGVQSCLSPFWLEMWQGGEKKGNKALSKEQQGRKAITKIF